LSGRYYMQLER